MRVLKFLSPLCKQKGLGWLLLFCLLLGGFLRFHQLDRKSLWADELFTLSMAIHHPLWPDPGTPFFERKSIFELKDGDSFLTAKAAEQSPPLNDLAEKLSASLLGPGELGARLPAAVSALLLLVWYAVWALRHPDTHVRRVLGWATFLLTFSPMLVLYAKDGRAYSMGVSLVGMAGLLWMLRWYRGAREWQAPSWPECVLWVLAFYSHYNAAIFPVLLLSLDAWQATRRVNGRAWGRLLSVGALCAVWVWLNMHTIFFTSAGGVAWQGNSRGFSIGPIVEGGLIVVERNWLALVLLIAAGLMLWGWYRRTLALSLRRYWQLLFLLLICVVYMLIAGLIVSRAGMTHPRYYIFMAPFAFVAMALVLGQLQSRFLQSAIVVLLVLAAVPALEFGRKLKNEDFRGISRLALQGFGEQSVILYPWEPNERIYRIYLEQMAGAQIRGKMIGISSKADAPLICNRLKPYAHVAVVAHDAGRDLIDEVYHNCQHQWPLRENLQLHNTYAEHWRKP